MGSSSTGGYGGALQGGINLVVLFKNQFIQGEIGDCCHRSFRSNLLILPQSLPLDITFQLSAVN